MENEPTAVASAPAPETSVSTVSGRLDYNTGNNINFSPKIENNAVQNISLAPQAEAIPSVRQIEVQTPADTEPTPTPESSPEPVVEPEAALPSTEEEPAKSELDSLKEQFAALNEKMDRILDQQADILKQIAAQNETILQLLQKRDGEDRKDGTTADPPSGDKWPGEDKIMADEGMRRLGDHFEAVDAGDDTEVAAPTEPDQPERPAEDENDEWEFDPPLKELDIVMVKNGDGEFEPWSVHKVEGNDVHLFQGPNTGPPFQKELHKNLKDLTRDARESGNEDDEVAKTKKYQKLKDTLSGRTALAWINGEGAKEEAKTDDPEKKRRIRLGCILGALATGALGYYLGSKFGLPHFGGGGNSDAAHHVREVVHTWNSTNEGHRYVQSILPASLEQHIVNGHEVITDKTTGATVVEHVTYKANGVYSDQTLSQLHQHGYETQALPNSIFDNDGGPGPTGNVDARYATEVTPQG